MPPSSSAFPYTLQMCFVGSDFEASQWATFSFASKQEIDAAIMRLSSAGAPDIQWFDYEGNTKRGAINLKRLIRVETFIDASALAAREGV